jgi:phage-related protein
MALDNSRSVEYKVSGWKLHPIKRRITFTDKKGISELKLLGQDLRNWHRRSLYYSIYVLK